MRDSLESQVRETKSAAACERARALVSQLGADAVVGLYAAMRSELDVTNLAEDFLEQGYKVVYPRVSDESPVLRFSRLHSSELEPGRFLVPEPPADSTFVELSQITAFIVPGLAFDTEGNRLGWGKGHYDQTLARCPDALRIGICFQEQIMAAVPFDATDQKMDWVVTDTGAFPGPRRNAWAHGVRAP